MAYTKVSSSGRGRGRGSQEKISLRKSGGIGISEAALQEYFTDDHEFVEVFFDEDNNKLGLLPKEDKGDDTYKLTRAKSGASVTPSSFLKANGLVPDITTNYEPFEDKVNGDMTLISIRTDEPQSTYGSPKSDDDNSSDESETDEE